jgi:ubiquinone/menaquinone biosynthesis C-methylase UbiE
MNPMVETKEVRDHYDSIYGTYEAHDPTIGKRLRKIRAYAEFTNKTVLDVAGGTGYIGQYVMEMGGTYINLDVSSGMLSLAKKKLWGLKGNHLLALSDVHAMPLREEIVDVALVSEVLEHVTSPRRVIREVGRILKPQGIIIVTNPNPWWGVIQWIAEKVKYKAEEGPHSYLRHKRLIEDIEKEGFTIHAVDMDFLPLDNKFWREIERYLKGSFLETFALKHYIIALKR